AGVVKVLNFFTDEGTQTAYIVMAYLDGMTLKDYLKSKGDRLPFEVARATMMPVMDTLREVHSAGMLHRDISPDNIFLTRSNQVKLIDFGAARYAIGERSRTLSVMLKHGYARLEQYSSRGRQGPATDLYALAATFYRAITGQTPSYSTDRSAHDDLKPPSQLAIQIPAEAERALMKALAIRYEDRFSDIASFQKVIAPIERAGGGGPGEGAAEVEPKSVAGRLKTLRITAAALLMAILLLGIGWSVDSNKLHGQVGSLDKQLDALKDEKGELDAQLKKMAGATERQPTVADINTLN